MKIKLPSNKARAWTRGYITVCVKFIASTISACMIASAVMRLNLKENNEYSFYGNARVCG